MSCRQSMESDSPFFRFPNRTAPPTSPPLAPLGASVAADTRVSAPELVYTTNEDFMDQVRLIVQVLAVVVMSAAVIMVSVTIVLIFTVKRLQLLIGVMRTETRTEGVRAGLLEADASVEEGCATAAGGHQKNGAGARPPPKNKSARKKFTDTNNTSCAIDGVDEEEDHRL